MLLLLAACDRSDPPAEAPAPRCDPYTDEGCGLPPRPAERRCLVDGTLPERLSQTGCLDGGAPGADLVPYDVISPLWSDGSGKGRWIVLDPGEALGFAAEGPWEWPAGSALLKQFSLASGPVETRILLRTDEGWASATYAWEGDDAVRIDDFELRHVDGVDWAFPAGEGCARCHLADEPLGPQTEQLARDVVFADHVASQLDAFDAIGLLDGYDGGDLPALADPADETLPLEDRARSYLHANCAHCHQPGGWTPVGMDLDLRWETPLALTNACEDAQYWDGASAGRRRIEPGLPEASELWLRMADASGTGPMPPYGSAVPDTAGIDLVRRWITSMESCP